MRAMVDSWVFVVTLTTLAVFNVSTTGIYQMISLTNLSRSQDQHWRNVVTPCARVEKQQSRMGTVVVVGRGSEMRPQRRMWLDCCVRSRYSPTNARETS